VCWTGTDAEYFHLYATAARTLKARFPELKIGGPGVGALGGFDGSGAFRPTEFVSAFLDFCRRESVPLDFFSWHCYTADAREFSARARAVRAMLDARGFEKTESHLNEWNYLPDNSWTPLSRKATPEERQRAYERMCGAEGAAFLMAALLDLQDAPVDVCALFHGELGGFGLFNEHGVPQKNYHALRAFRALLNTPRRITVGHTEVDELVAAAGLAQDGASASLLIVDFDPGAKELAITLRGAPWQGATQREVRVIDSTRSLDLPAPAESLPAFPETITVASSGGPSIFLLNLRKGP
jgi:hypothetical protein